MPSLNYLAVLVSAVVLFVLGGLWFSLIFANPWRRMMGITGPQASPGAALFAQLFVCALVTSWGMAAVLSHVGTMDVGRAIGFAILCWVGFAGATSYATAAAGGKQRAQWAIESGYNLVSFIVAAAILSAWH
jgi:Protein of unknown function (DUF1761)